MLFWMVAGADASRNTHESGVQTCETCESWKVWLVAPMALRCMAFLVSLGSRARHSDVPEPADCVELADLSETCMAMFEDNRNRSACNAPGPEPEFWNNIWFYLCGLLTRCIAYLKVSPRRLRKRFEEVTGLLHASREDALEIKDTGVQFCVERRSLSTETVRLSSRDGIIQTEERQQLISTVAGEVGPESIQVSSTDRCYHHSSCHMLSNSTTGTVKSLRRCERRGAALS